MQRHIVLCGWIAFLLFLSSPPLPSRGGDEPAKPNNLYDAADRGDLETIKRLIESGVKPEDQRNKFGDTALMCAAFRGHLAIMRFLIAKGADVNAESDKQTYFIDDGPKARSVRGGGASALDHAADGGHVEAAVLLIEKGADVNHIGVFGTIPLHHAVQFGGSRANQPGGSKEICKLLLDKGTNVNAKWGSGFTALMSAAWKGNWEIAELLVDHGADVNVISADGYAALLSAVRQGRQPVVEFLIAKGADVKVKGRDGSTLLKIAKERFKATGNEAYDAIARTLAAHGATE